MFPLRPRALAVVMRVVAALGLVAALLGGVVGWTLLGQVESVLADSVALTADTLDSLEGTADVAAASVAALSGSLEQLRQTSVSLEVAFDDGEVLLEELADLLRDDVATSISAIDEALPGLIRVGGTIDTTLSALSTLPFGPAYDPDESFADSLRTLDSSLDGVPERLVEQADLVDESSESLGAVGRGVSRLTGELAVFDDRLAETTQLLEDYRTTISDGSTLIREASRQFDRQVALGRLALVLAVAAFAGLQIVPLQMAATALHGARAAEADEVSPAVGDEDVTVAG